MLKNKQNSFPSKQGCSVLAIYCKLKFFGKKHFFASKTKEVFKQSKCLKWADDKENF